MAMRKKPGPKTDNPKNFTLRVRLDDQTLEVLDQCAEAFNSSRSEIVRKGIYVIWNGINK